MCNMQSTHPNCTVPRRNACTHSKLCGFSQYYLMFHDGINECYTYFRVFAMCCFMIFFYNFFLSTFCSILSGSLNNIISTGHCLHLFLFCMLLYILFNFSSFTFTYLNILSSVVSVALNI